MPLGCLQGGYLVIYDSGEVFFATSSMDAISLHSYCMQRSVYTLLHAAISLHIFTKQLLCSKELLAGQDHPSSASRSATCGIDAISLLRILVYPGGNPGENLKSISQRCYLREVAFEWELTEETISLPLGCLQGVCLVIHDSG